MPVTLVTGTSTGIGFATALHFARHGHQVIATMRDLAKAAPLESAARAESLPLVVRALDVTRPESVEQVVAATREREGRSTSSSTTRGSGARRRSSSRPRPSTGRCSRPTTGGRSG